MKNIFDSVIKRGGYNLTGLLDKINTYHVEGKLTDEERDELIVEARNHAQANDSLDVLAKLSDLEQRVKKLEAQASTGGNAGSGTSSEYAEYVVGKWYYANDRITFEGSKYVCIAPLKQVCTWSPSEYPTFWKKVA